MRPENIVNSSFGRSEHYSPVLLHPDLIVKRAQSSELIREALQLMAALEADDYTRFLSDYYQGGLRAFGEEWAYADIVTVLLAASRTVRPANYLEIGVRRGRSLAAVVSQSPDVEVYAADMWMANYGNNPNPGPEWVSAEMFRCGYSKPITFLNGDSRQTIPQLFAQNPSLTFDMITVDGDHSYEGALNDLQNVLPRLAVGGVIIFDDISHPRLPGLMQAWRKAIQNDPGMLAAEFTSLGYGVGVGVRHRPFGRIERSSTPRARTLRSRLSRKAASLLRG